MAKRTFNKSCRKKKVFDTEAAAQAQVESHGPGNGYEAYKCHFVEGHWHIGHVRGWNRYHRGAAAQ